MKLISFWNPKGGQGKSTLSINIAGAAVDIGLSVLLVDRDMQGTASIFHEDGHLPFEVVHNLPKENPNVDLIIMDHMASDEEMPISPLLVIPFLPKRSQFKHYTLNSRKAELAGKRIISVVTNTDSRNKVQRQLVNASRKLGVFEVKAGAAFDHADAEYRTIFDKKFNSSSNVDRSRNEMKNLLSSILQNFNSI